MYEQAVLRPAHIHVINLSATSVKRTLEACVTRPATCGKLRYRSVVQVVCKYVVACNDCAAIRTDCIKVCLRFDCKRYVHYFRVRNLRHRTHDSRFVEFAERKTCAAKIYRYGACRRRCGVVVAVDRYNYTVVCYKRCVGERCARFFRIRFRIYRIPYLRRLYKANARRPRRYASCNFREGICLDYTAAKRYRCLNFLTDYVIVLRNIQLACVKRYVRKRNVLHRSTKEQGICILLTRLRTQNFLVLNRYVAHLDSCRAAAECIVRKDTTLILVTCCNVRQ